MTHQVNGAKRRFRILDEEINELSFPAQKCKFYFVINFFSTIDLLTLYAEQPVEHRALRLWDIQYLMPKQTNQWR